MLKKMALSIVVMVLLAGLAILAAQQEKDEPDSQQVQRPAGQDRRGRFRSTGRSDLSAIDKAPIGKDEKEKKILAVLNDMDKNQRRGMMNVSMQDGRLLRLLTETVGAKHVVEVGTSNGYSSIWFCLALSRTDGKLTTYEINARRASLARENFKRAGVDKLVTLVEGDAHKEVTKLKEQIDILFLDADKEGYIDYLNKLLPLVRPGGLIIAHNITPWQADPKYVEAITTNPNLETILLHRQGGGVSVTLKKRLLPTVQQINPQFLSVFQQINPLFKKYREPDVIFVPTPQDVVDRMLELAEVQKSDLVYDLGCGDGRIVVTAAKRYGCKAIGYDIDPERIKESLENVQENNVANLVRIEQKDIFTLDLSKADVITLYLLPSLNEKLIPQLEKLKPGTRVVSHDFDMSGVKPEKVITLISSDDQSEHTIYLWTAPIKKENGI